MFCFNVRRNLIPYLEKSLDRRKNAAVRRHLEVCPKCAAELSSIKAVSGAVRNAKTPAMEPSTDLWARIEREIADPTPSRRQFPVVRGLKLSGGAIAAAVLVFMVMNANIGNSPLGPTNQPTVKTDQKVARNPVAPEVKHQPAVNSDIANLKTAEEASTITTPAQVRHHIAKIVEPKPVQIAEKVADVKAKVVDIDQSIKQIDTKTRGSDNVMMGSNKPKQDNDQGQVEEDQTPPPMGAFASNSSVRYPVRRSAPVIDEIPQTSVDKMNNADSGSRSDTLFTYP